MATASQHLAAFASSLEFEAIPEEVITAAKLHILDIVGCALAAHGVGAADYVRAGALASGGLGKASVVGDSVSRSPGVAALANGGLAHALDFDDTHTPSICHISAVVVPAALAMAETAGASGRALLTAIVAGNEAVARIGSAAAPAYMKTGFHPTSVCGVFGSTLAATHLRGLAEAPTTHALGIAGSMASGLFEYLGDGSTTKAVNAGWAAHAGVLAALLAEAGGDGPATVIEGRFGVFATHFRLDSSGSLADEWGLGTRWETPAISFKPYPACHFIHSALDVARSLLDDGLDPLELDDVLVAVPKPAVPLVLEPWADKVRPRTPFDAKFSLPYSLAAMFLRGEVGINSYVPSAIADDDVLDLAARVRYEIEEFPSYPAALPARVTVRTRSGETLTRVGPDGPSQAPLAAPEVLGKFRLNAGLALTASDVRELASALLELEGRDDLSRALAPIRRAQPRC